ncbi:MAG: group intron reverse transcriptase/maturase [Pseudomonadota bacterium]
MGSGSFELLGFTRFWGKSRKDPWVVKRQTARGRFGRALQRVSLGGRQHLHDKIAGQQQRLQPKVKGQGGYFGITGNASALAAFLYEVKRTWQKWLKRRTGRGAVAALRARAVALPASMPRGRPQHLPDVANPWTKSRMLESGTSGSVGAPSTARDSPPGFRIASWQALGTLPTR